jgi:hypothetical protein
MFCRFLAYHFLSARCAQERKMKRQVIRVIFVLPVLAMLSGCIVEGGGYGRWHPHYYHGR